MFLLSESKNITAFLSDFNLFISWVFKLEKQILNLEGSILEQEQNIIYSIKELKEIIQKKEN